MDVVTLHDQMVRVAKFSCVFFTAMAGNKAEPGRLYVVLCSKPTEKVGFSGSKTRLQSRAGNE